MNPGQANFYNFIMERVQTGKETEIKAILEESFKKQDEGTFSPEYMGQIMPKMLELVRPECLDELKNAAAHMRSQMN